MHLKSYMLCGNIEVLQEFSIACVGARRCTSLGREYAEKICEGIAKAKIPIVSGFAFGIDTVAHQTAISFKQKTIAILAGGFQHIYPKENQKMVEEILRYGGVLISEYEEDVEPRKALFPQRNRLIAALSNGVIVIEAGANSGSLITANYAAKLHKTLFVLPGRVCDENYEGSNQLLVEGAKCVLTAEDVLKAFPQIERKDIHKSSARKKIPMEYQKIYELLKEPMDVNQLAREVSQNVAKVQGILTMMEMDGYTRQIARGIYGIKK